MMDYEFEYLAWKGRQLALRQKYADTPPGLGPGQAALEESCQRAALEEYQNRRKWSLTTGVQIPEEPFVGRGKELVKIRKFFEDGVRVVFLSGMGGIGKSALARTYGRVYACHYDKILLWSYDGDLEHVFTDDGQLGISNLVYSQDKYKSRRQYAREKYRRFLQIAESERLLVILDNYNRMGDPWLESLLKASCDLLVTTRLSGSVLSGYGVLTLESLQDPEDWKAFYRLYTRKEPQGREWEEIEAYRESVLGHTLKMKLALSNPDQRWTSERLARSILKNFRLKKGEKQILCELSFLSIQGIPQEVYLSCTQEGKECLDSLKSYSLVQEREDPAGRKILSLHPVIMEAVLTMWHPTLSRCLAFMEAFTLYARYSWYRQRKEDFWLASRVFVILERLPEPVAWRFYIYECMATFLMEWEYYTEAEQLDRKLYECVRAYYGEEHQFTAQMSLRVAMLLHNQMRYEESLPWIEQASQLYKKSKPVNRHFYVDQEEACEKLARSYEHLGRFEEAHRLLDEAFIAIENFKKETEVADPKLWLMKRQRWAFIYHRRATLYFKQGDLDAAQEALDIGTNLFEMSEYARLEARRQLQVAIYFARGEYGKARDAAAEDLDICIRYQGDSVIISLNYRELLGDAYFALGDLRAAEDEYIKVLSGVQERFPHKTERIDRLRRKLGRIS